MRVRAAPHVAGRFPYVVLLERSTSTLLRSRSLHRSENIKALDPVQVSSVEDKYAGYVSII